MRAIFRVGVFALRKGEQERSQWSARKNSQILNFGAWSEPTLLPVPNAFSFANARFRRALGSTVIGFHASQPLKLGVAAWTEANAARLAGPVENPFIQAN